MDDQGSKENKDLAGDVIDFMYDNAIKMLESRRKSNEILSGKVYGLLLIVLGIVSYLFTKVLAHLNVTSIFCLIESFNNVKIVLALFFLVYYSILLLRLFILSKLVVVFDGYYLPEFIESESKDQKLKQVKLEICRKLNENLKVAHRGVAAKAKKFDNVIGYIIILPKVYDLFRWLYMGFKNLIKEVIDFDLFGFFVGVIIPFSIWSILIWFNVTDVMRFTDVCTKSFMVIGTILSTIAFVDDLPVVENQLSRSLKRFVFFLGIGLLFISMIIDLVTYVAWG